MLLSNCPPGTNFEPSGRANAGKQQCYLESLGLSTRESILVQEHFLPSEDKGLF